MKLEELSLLQNGDLSDHDIEKLNIVLAFYERLPTEAMKRELLQLMENQPTMVPGEFDKRLDDFAVRVKSADNYVYFSAYLASAALYACISQCGVRFCGLRGAVGLTFS